MSSPATIDIDALVQPLGGGSPLSSTLRLDLDKWRKEPDPDFDDSSNYRPEWAKVIEATTNALMRDGKDLTLAARLAEALTKKHGAAGLRDGLKLLRRLFVDCEPELHPIPDADDGQEVRRNRIDWLNDAGKGGKFPRTVLQIPIVVANNGEPYSFVDTLNADRKGQVAEAIASCDLKALQNTCEVLIEAKAALDELAALLDEKLGVDSPNMNGDEASNLGTALGKCLEFAEGTAAKRGLRKAVVVAASAEMPAGRSAPSHPSAPAGNREGLYQQIAEVAEALKRIEPHSPIPYLLERCVRLGALPFPELMREVIQETATLSELDRLMGIAKPAAAE